MTERKRFRKRLRNRLRDFLVILPSFFGLFGNF
jgi:hypothetical protein